MHRNAGVDARIRVVDMWTSRKVCDSPLFTASFNTRLRHPELNFRNSTQLVCRHPLRLKPDPGKWTTPKPENRVIVFLATRLGGATNLDISIRIRFHFTTAYMWFYQDSVVLRLAVVCVWSSGAIRMTTRPGSTPSALAPPHHPRFSILTAGRVLRALPQNNSDQLPLFFSRMPRWAPSTASTSTRSAFAIGLFPAHDASLRTTSALATSTRATSTRARSCRAGNPQRSQRRHRPRLDRRHRPRLDRRHRPRLDRRPRRGRPSSTRSTFAIDFVAARRGAAGDPNAGYRRKWIYPLPSNEGDVFFSSRVRAVPSRSAVGCVAAVLLFCLSLVNSDIHLRDRPKRATLGRKNPKADQSARSGTHRGFVGWSSPLESPGVDLTWQISPS